MAEVRPFGTENSRPVPRPGVVRVQASVIQIAASAVAGLSREALAERYQGVPIILDQPTSVVALLFDQRAEIDEHDAPFPILFVVIGGSGFVRVGGPDAQAMKIHAGYAVLWPPHVPHKAWTDDEPMQAISIEYAAGS